MFWSKIWFFLVATAAILGIGIALTVPRPAERKVLESEDVRLERAMDAARLWLVVEARTRADTALRYARYEIYKELKRIKEDAASAKAIAQQLHDSARKEHHKHKAHKQRQLPARALSSQLGQRRSALFRIPQQQEQTNASDKNSNRQDEKRERVCAN